MNWNARTLWYLLLSLSTLTAGPVACQDRRPAAAETAFGLATETLRVGGVPLTVEIADTPQKSATGLMFRDSLPPDRGMIFVFDETRRANFWMKNTRIPLSIGFLDASGQLLEIRDMRPFDETPVASQSDRVAYALEVNQGWFSAHRVSPGARVEGLKRH